MSSFQDQIVQLHKNETAFYKFISNHPKDYKVGHWLVFVNEKLAGHGETEEIALKSVGDLNCYCKQVPKPNEVQDAESKTYCSVCFSVEQPDKWKFDSIFGMHRYCRNCHEKEQAFFKRIRQEYEKEQEQEQEDESSEDDEFTFYPNMFCKVCKKMMPSDNHQCIGCKNKFIL